MPNVEATWSSIPCPSLAPKLKFCGDSEKSPPKCCTLKPPFLPCPMRMWSSASFPEARAARASLITPIGMTLPSLRDGYARRHNRHPNPAISPQLNAVAYRRRPCGQVLAADYPVGGCGDGMRCRILCQHEDRFAVVARG